MASSNVLVPVEQKDVVFYEDVITAVMIESARKQEIYVPLRPICAFLGVDWSAQFRRINLSDSVQGVAITTTPSPGRGGGEQEMSCLPLKYLPGWLFGSGAARVKSELQEKTVRYQRESYDVLWEAFQEGRLTGTNAFDDLLASDTPAEKRLEKAGVTPTNQSHRNYVGHCLSE